MKVLFFSTISSVCSNNVTQKIFLIISHLVASPTLKILNRVCNEVKITAVDKICGCIFPQGVNAAFDVLLICNVNVYEFGHRLLFRKNPPDVS